MNRQQFVQPLSANGFSRRITDKEIGTRVDNMLVTGKIVPSFLRGDNVGGSDSPSHERLVYLATCLIGHPVEVQVIDGSVFSGIFHATNADFGIILKMARLMKTGSSHGQMNILDYVNKPPSKTLIIPARELVQVVAKDVSVTRDGLANEIQQVKQQEMMTDSSISQSRHVEVGRELERWVPDDDDRECPELDNIFDGPWNRGWDQFEANEALFGVKSTFDEDLYTTKLDRGPQMRELEMEALRIAREIEGEDTQDLHLAEERGLQLHGDYEMDEEARFSSVFRTVDDSGFDERENLLDFRNSETFGDVSGFVGGKSFPDFPSGRSIDAAQLLSISSTMGLVESSQSITGSEQYLPVSDNKKFSFDRGSRFQEFRFSDKLVDYSKDELEAPNVAEEGQASKHAYSHPSTRPKRASSDKVGLSPNAAAYAPTSSTYGKNFPSDLSENAPSAKQHETTQPILKRAQPGSSTSSASDFGNAIPASTFTGLSPSSSVGSLASERSTLNPNAKEFKFNPNAKSFSPTKTSFRPASPVSAHHEIVSLLLESGVDINLRNYRGQTALMQACQYGHWEVVLTLVLFKANMHRADYLNGGTALHLAALNGHSRCIRILLADYIPSVPNFCNILNKRSRTEESISEFDRRSLYQVINGTSDGGITALHMAALNGHVDSVHLLIELGASVSEVTVEDGTTIDLIGAGSTPLHYAACGGNAQCCQILIAKGASLTAVNANGWTPLAVAHSWHRDGLEDILTPQAQEQSYLALPPSPYLCLPFMSIVKIARECGWRSGDSLNTCMDPCVVCLERKCTVAAEGCYHEFCTRCALYLCSTNCTTTVAHGPPGSIACPLCRHGIVSFVKLEATSPIVKDIARTSLSLSFCTCTALGSDTLETPFCKPDVHSARFSPTGSSFRSLSCHKLSLLKMNPSLCMGASDSKCLKSSYRRSTSINSDRSKSWLCSLHQCVATGIEY